MTAQTQNAFSIFNQRKEALHNDSLKRQRERFFNFILNCREEVRFFEMYPVENKTGSSFREIKNPCYFSNKEYSETSLANTRTQLQSETSLEIDKLSMDKSTALVCETCLSLIRNNFSFYLFYADGGRSAWIKIYDLCELKQLDPLQQIKTQIQFWRKHVPFGCFQYVDTGVFDKSHFVPLEFSVHWKHKTPFNLLFYYEAPQSKIKNVFEETHEEKILRFANIAEETALNRQRVEIQSLRNHLKFLNYVDELNKGVLEYAKIRA